MEFINMGINVNDKHYPFTEWIGDLSKTIETRNTPTLRCYLGKRVGIVRTGKGKAQCIGFATVSEEVVYHDSSDFYSDPRHCITPGMNKGNFTFNGVKYGYLLTGFEACEPFAPVGRGIVARKLFA